MKRLFWIAPAIALLAAFFASTHPDGLDFVAEKSGFAHKAVEHFAPMAGYSLKVIPDGGISTAFAGFLGVLIVMAGFRFVVIVTKRDR